MNFIEEKFNSPQLSGLISANYEKLKNQCESHGRFHGEIDKRRGDVKNLLEQQTQNLINNKSDSIKQEITQKIQTIKISWNNLLTKSNNYKEKLNICIELAERFNILSTDMSQWLNLMSKKVQASSIQNLNKVKRE